MEYLPTNEKEVDVMDLPIMESLRIDYFSIQLKFIKQTKRNKTKFDFINNQNIIVISWLSAVI